jgi:hypothetical protein
MALTKTTTAIGLVILVAVAATVSYIGWRMYTANQNSVCQVCQRPVHSHSRTEAEVDDQLQDEFCCPTCAVTAALQSGHQLRFVELTDYISGASLDPEDAFLVRGSDVNPCMEEHSLTHSDKQAAQMDFDRCSPSILAFGDRKTAEEFVANRGGSLILASDLEAK